MCILSARLKGYLGLLIAILQKPSSVCVSATGSRVAGNLPISRQTDNLRTSKVKELKVTAQLEMALPLFILFLLGFLCNAFAAPISYVDMSYTYNNETMYYPRLQKFVYTKIVQGNIANVTYNYREFSTAEHGGTHVDAPTHFGGDLSIDQIPLESLRGPAVVIDITEKAKLDRDACVTVGDLLKWERRHGFIPKESLVFMDSGWGKKWPNVPEFFGNDREDALDFHFPGFCPKAVEFLLSNRSINGVGVDTPSFDVGSSATFPSHFLLATANKIGLEFVANLDQVPPAGAYAYALPMKLGEGTGAPARVFAILGREY